MFILYQTKMSKVYKLDNRSRCYSPIHHTLR